MGRGPLGNQDLDYCIQSAACRMCGIVSINMGQKEENYVGGQIIKAVFERRLYSGYEDSGDENANENYDMDVNNNVNGVMQQSRWIIVIERGVENGNSFERFQFGLNIGHNDIYKYSMQQYMDDVRQRQNRELTYDGVEEAREDFLSVCLLNLLNRGFNAQDVMEQMYNNVDRIFEGYVMDLLYTRNVRIVCKYGEAMWEMSGAYKNQFIGWDVKDCCIFSDVNDVVHEVDGCLYELYHMLLIKDGLQVYDWAAMLSLHADEFLSINGMGQIAAEEAVLAYEQLHPEMMNNNHMIHNNSDVQVTFRGWKRLLRENGMAGLYDVIENYRIGTVNPDSAVQFLLFMGATTKCANALETCVRDCQHWMEGNGILPSGGINFDEFMKMMFGISTNSDFAQFCARNVSYQNDSLIVSDYIADGALFRSMFVNV